MAARESRRSDGGDFGRAMTTSDLDSTAAAARVFAGAHPHDPLRRLAERAPRPLRFLGVGAIGLLTDVSVFTAINAYVAAPLSVRLVSLAAATLVTWRLNRALTFDASGRRQDEEAMRYVAVTVVAQGVSYAVFAALVLSMLHWFPQAALVTGAAVAAVFSYFGHRLFAFAPHRAGASSGSSRGSQRP
jgi:putative flippase GtrA